MDKLKEIAQFFNHVILTLSLIRKNYLKIGKRKVLSTYFKICFRYISEEIVLNRKIEEVSIFDNKILIPNFRLFITAFESVFIYDEYYFKTHKKKPTIVDCGANIGLSVLYFKLFYPNSKIIAIEPHPEVFEALKRNQKLNKWNITLVNSALSNKSRKTEFYFDSKEPGSMTGSTIKDRVSNNRTSAIVKSTKLSSIVKKIRRIDFLKMDIEGDEEKVITEMQQSGEINKIQQTVIEYHHHIDPSVYRISKILKLLEKAKLNYVISTYKAYSPFAKGQYQDILIYAYHES